jgi:hypothetical protein
MYLNIAFHSRELRNRQRFCPTEVPRGTRLKSGEVTNIIVNHSTTIITIHQHHRQSHRHHHHHHHHHNPPTSLSITPPPPSSSSSLGQSRPAGGKA